ncbi:MAG: hemolysin family protein, partial [Planctomycetia bacterium]
MESVAWELSAILLLLLANGFFAGAEIAILAAGRGKLQQLAEGGDASAKVALELGSDPNRFLPTVQVGITLVSTCAAAFGGARVVNSLEAALKSSSNGFIAEHSGEIAFVVVVGAITYLSVVVGELLPKRLALRNAVLLARFVAKPMDWLSWIARPVVVFMGVSTDALLWLVGVRGAQEPSVSLEDIQHLIRQGASAGVVEPLEQRVAAEALRLGDHTVRRIMQPRLDVDAIDVATPAEEVAGVLAMAGFTRLPVYEGNLDNVIGFVHLQDVFRQQYMGWKFDLRKLVRPALFVPETLTIDRLLEKFQQNHTKFAVVLDEFGGME